jgi:formate/nitrite transporter FocA (FNT family)
MEPGRTGRATRLGRGERRSARARASPAAEVVHESIRVEGEHELARPSSALLWSAVAAGLSMGFSLVGEAVIRAALPAAPWTPLVAKLGYALGFLFVVLGRQQLFTETTLLVVLPFLAAPSGRGLAGVARVWAIVLSGNVAGAALIAASLTSGTLFDATLRAEFAEIGRRALDPGPLGIFGRGVYGGWLIALMAWLLPAARSARFFVVVTVAWLVGVGEFSHSVAGSVDVLHLVTLGEVSPGAFFLSFLLPAVAGNSVGGVALVAALNHAQVVAGSRAP